jgi:myo-inositol-1(or 4)-monophosphatase
MTPIENHSPTAAPVDVLQFAIALALKTGMLLLEHYQPTGSTAQLKADRTAVTAADLAADQLLQAEIWAAFPEDGILSEEGNTVYPADKPAVWVIDPLDGTTNFSLGLHHWGVSIARLVDGEPALGVLYFPLLEELFSAQRGGGAFLNGAPLRVIPPDPVRPFSFFSCCSRTHQRYHVSLRYKARILGSAAYGLATVARGSAALALEVTPKVWDFAASWLITREAGGVIAPLGGAAPFPLEAGSDYGGRVYPLLTAATPKLWSEGQAKITPKEPAR